MLSALKMWTNSNPVGPSPITIIEAGKCGISWAVAGEKTVLPSGARGGGTNGVDPAATMNASATNVMASSESLSISSWLGDWNEALPLTIRTSKIIQQLCLLSSPPPGDSVCMRMHAR